ncbi:sigma-70 family RNA polymerase sigma factor [Variovorax sp. J22P168]|uniref:sigma-70 family RNA polymerase sigma factor n=1 Tax=Variovorax jilinensis TaxID=3053513 RepID=UPI002576F580|nr:sigma-70 family RNA polymerase sigma factor [Variovorax sp. J22P168]MDM0014731.1 sigma-70 family RNA polymerase sigma factor [Variovorax sp. J22P168]
MHPSTPEIRALYVAHQGWLRGWLSGRLRCGFAASDLTHDTFVNLMEQPELPTLRQPRAFLQVVASRLMINRFHRMTVEAEVLRAVAMTSEGDLAPSAEEQASQRQMLGQVLAMLAHELDEKSRTAFVLARVDGQSYREIATRLGVSETRVKQYLAKVLLHCHGRMTAATSPSSQSAT